MAVGRVLVGMAVLSLSVTAVVSADSGKPDLAEIAVTVSQRGASLHVTDTVRNIGKAAAPSSRAGYYLETTRIAGRAVRSLRPREVSRGTKKLTIPSSVARGSYRLRVCADARSRIQESNERNNCRAARRLVLVGDWTPPTFRGLTAATTCIPGPIGGDRSTPYRLRWDAAKDDVTPSESLVYDVYQATRPGEEDFAKPAYTTAAGATAFSTPPLPSSSDYYFVVRARDRAGNRDTNTVERMGVNLCA